MGSPWPGGDWRLDGRRHVGHGSAIAVQSKSLRDCDAPAGSPRRRREQAALGRSRQPAPPVCQRPRRSRRTGGPPGGLPHLARPFQPDAPLLPDRRPAGPRPLAGCRPPGGTRGRRRPSRGPGFARGSPVGGRDQPLAWPKGSTWLLHGANGRPAHARYLPPLALARPPAWASRPLRRWADDQGTILAPDAGFLQAVGVVETHLPERLARQERRHVEEH